MAKHTSTPPARTTRVPIAPPPGVSPEAYARQRTALLRTPHPTAAARENEAAAAKLPRTLIGLSHEDAAAEASAAAAKP